MNLKEQKEKEKVLLEMRYDEYKANKINYSLLIDFISGMLYNDIDDIDVIADVDNVYIDYTIGNNVFPICVDKLNYV